MPLRLCVQLLVLLGAEWSQICELWLCELYFVKSI